MKLRLFITSAFIIALASCSKDGIITTNCKTCTEMKIVVGLKHHSRVISTGKVYIKYEATDKPSSYDESANVKMTEDGPLAIFERKLPGRYYIYADGYDTTIMQEVSGGIPVVVSNDYLYTNFTTTVPVTEAGH